MKENYYNSIVMIEKLHRTFLEVLKIELNKLRIRDISNIQSLLLYNIGRNKMTVGELTARGCYLGTNVTYSLRKMVESGYLFQCPVDHDRRSSEVSLTDKGLEMYEVIDNIIDNQANGLQKSDIDDKMIKDMDRTMTDIEKYLKKSSSY